MLETGREKGRLWGEDDRRRRRAGPCVILVVGVNGTGKTTSIAKLAQSYREDGDEGGDRRRRHLPRRRHRADQELGRRRRRRSGRAQAGRRPGRRRLRRDDRRREPQRRRRAHRHRRPPAHEVQPHGGARQDSPRSSSASCPKARDEVLLVLDATTGQNALVQAKAFAEVVPITALCLTKLDGTSKGGIVFAVVGPARDPGALHRHRREAGGPDAVRCDRVRRGAVSGVGRNLLLYVTSHALRALPSTFAMLDRMLLDAR